MEYETVQLFDYDEKSEVGHTSFRGFNISVLLILVLAFLIFKVMRIYGTEKQSINEI